MWSSLSGAATLYKYKDAQGRWVMTDQAPSDKTPQNIQASRLVFTQKTRRFDVINRGTRQKPLIYAVNPYAGPVELWMEFTTQQNVKLSQNEPYYWIIPAKTDLFLMSLAPQDAKQSWAYQWNIHFVPGAPMAIDVQKPMVVDLPFKGGPFVVSQSFMGEASHKQNIQAHYAVDFVMPERTPIVAALAGVVMEAEQQFSRSGWQAEYADEANFVRILHPNGFMTVYAHLAPDSFQVVEGQSVAAGQLLGYSGTTGFSTGPHLHFVVQVNSGKQLQSFPWLIRGDSSPPAVGQSYKN